MAAVCQSNWGHCTISHHRWMQSSWTWGMRTRTGGLSPGGALPRSCGRTGQPQCRRRSTSALPRYCLHCLNCLNCLNCLYLDMSNPCLRTACTAWNHPAPDLAAAACDPVQRSWRHAVRMPVSSGCTLHHRNGSTTSCGSVSPSRKHPLSHSNKKSQLTLLSSRSVPKALPG